MSMRASEHIPESDWKRWKALSKDALNRYCQKVLSKVAQFETDGGTPHERYAKLWNYLREADRKLADVFDDQRRSSAIIQIALALKHEIIHRSDLNEFSESTQESIDVITGKP